MSEKWIDLNFPKSKNRDDYESVMQLNRRTELKILKTDYNPNATYTPIKNIPIRVITNNDQTKNILSGSFWRSDFYHYRNNYFFVTDSTGFSQDGQFLWSTPVDTALYHNSPDSIMFEGDDPFKYSLADTILTIKYSSAEHNPNNNTRIFHRRLSDSAFVSEYEYTYGREVLYFKNKIKK